MMIFVVLIPAIAIDFTMDYDVVIPVMKDPFHDVSCLSYSGLAHS